MKALSIRQPWAWLIANGFKDIENRTWQTHYRGPVLIHASQGMTRAEFNDAMAFVHQLGVDLSRVKTDGSQLDRGGIVGVATVTDCVRSSDSPWHIPGCWGFRLADARPLPFLPCKGELGFFNVPLDVALRLQATGGAA